MTHIIYLPGFGDRYDGLRRFALRRWEDDDTTVTFVPMQWTNKNETYEQKYQRVADAIEKISGNVVLVGESAGGAMALFAFSRLPKQVDQVITVCGYSHGAADVHQIHQHKRPAFYQLMPQVDKAVESLSTSDARHITTIYSSYDRIVTPNHSRIRDAREVELHTRGHLLTITRALIKKFPLQYIN